MAELFDEGEIAKLVGISESQVRYWSRTGLIPPVGRRGGKALFDFKALVAFRTVKRLREEGISVRRIRGYMEALRRMMPDVDQPLAEVSVSVVGRGVVFNREGVRMDPRGQLVLDFSPKGESTVARISTDSSEELFFQGLGYEEEGRWEPMHHPFTAPRDEDIPLLDSDPGRVRAKHYDFVCNGYELSSGSIRIHRSDLQMKIFRLLGYSDEEIAALNLFDIIHPDSLEHCRQVFQRVIDGESVNNIEAVFVAKNGAQIIVEGNVNCRYRKGKPFATRGIFRNVTDRKRTEEELRASEAKYRDLFESSRDVIYISSPEGEIIDINPAAEELFGYTRAEMLGMDAHRLYADPTARERFSRTIKERGFVRDFEVKFRRKDGGELDCLETAISRWNAEGDIVEYQGIIRDVTEQKKLQAQLVQAMQMESIGRLAGGIAHDFNNLLTVIIGCAELASYELSPHDPLREEIDEILKAADHARDLTRRLLAFSRKQMLEEKVLNINEIIANLDKMLRRILGEDLIYETVLASDLHPVKVDPGQIEDVIINLVINARDAMPRGGNLTIETANVYLDEMYTRTHREVIPGDYVMIAVTDTGCGISDEMLDRIFEPFFTTKQPGMGTGLGLSTAYGIVKQSRGYIFVYSEVGKGTTFKVYLPRVKEEPEELEEKVVPEGLPRGSETILVVEDEPGVLGMAERTLKRQGYEVLTAKNGGEAYLLCKQRERPVDLVLTDIVMPHMSGVQFVEQLRGIWPYIKVLYMSGYPAHAAINNGMLGPDAPFMMKPYSPRDLVLKVREVLDREAAG